MFLIPKLWRKKKSNKERSRHFYFSSKVTHDLEHVAPQYVLRDYALPAAHCNILEVTCWDLHPLTTRCMCRQLACCLEAANKKIGQLPALEALPRLAW